MKFRKKPLEVEAIQSDNCSLEELSRFCGLHWGRADVHDMPMHDDEGIVIWNQLSEQWLVVHNGDWIIRGTEGELYPCDPEVFKKTYNPLYPALED